jgi:DNA polymerase-3 subunit gamma/tau
VDTQVLATNIEAIPVRVQADSRAEAVITPNSPALVPTEDGAFWHALVQQLIEKEAIAALVRELALQSELQSQGSGTWCLRVESPSLNQGDACQALLLALQSLPASPKYQTAERLQVEIGPATDTPARRHAALMAERQQQAEQLIDQDPLVQDMVRNWGARIVPGSVRMQAAAAVTGQAKPI